ncbi:hypothetical protein TrVE_jg7616 [Triparma verrucosa]|uniref:Protein ENHANCED DISEASE RESISTANCE 2 C-terminal domain-containing protein n=1 Tax=Triparma verrucosa TaxID=1606542 RepID=A0A9W7C2P6_9STRA|nr:hypothetical protein TrVE_jg7616 [Triparma verrucosa]
MEMDNDSVYSRGVRSSQKRQDSENLKGDLGQRRSAKKPATVNTKSDFSNWLESIVTGCTKNSERCVLSPSHESEEEEEGNDFSTISCMPRSLRKSSSKGFFPSAKKAEVDCGILPPTGTIFAMNSDQSNVKRRQKQVDKLHKAKIKGDPNIGVSTEGSWSTPWRKSTHSTDTDEEEEGEGDEVFDEGTVAYDEQTTVVTTTEAIHSLGIIQPSMSGLSDESSLSPSLQQGKMPHIPTLNNIYQGLRVSNPFERIFKQISVTVKRINNGDGLGGDCEETVHHHSETDKHRTREVVLAGWQNAWSEPHAAHFRTRAKAYLHCGLKTASASSLFGVVGVDSFKSDTPVHSIMERPYSYLQRFRDAVMQLNASREARRETILRVPFLLVFNFILPWGNLVVYCSRPTGPINKDSPAEMLWEKFLRTEHGDFRRSRLKMIPNVGKGPWVVKKLVGGKPAIIGHKVPIAFHGNKQLNFLEVEIDVSQGGAFANSIANSVMGKSDLLTVDLAFLIEGQTEEELPESLLAVVRLHHLKMGLAPTITEWDETQRARRPAWETEDDFNQSGEGGEILTGNSYLIDV